MGVSGNSVGLLIQQPVSLNDATVQTALQSVGAIKASLAAVGSHTSGTGQAFRLRPVVMGFESAQRRPRYINALREYIYNSTFTLKVSDGTGGTAGVVEVSADSGSVTDVSPYAALLKDVRAVQRIALRSGPGARQELAHFVELQIAQKPELAKQIRATRLPADPLQKIEVMENAIAKQHVASQGRDVGAASTGAARPSNTSRR